MLYDVLPPLVFFVSLGGIILVVSRAMVRIRREQFASDIRSATAAIGDQGASSPRRLAGILGPSRRKITAIKTPVALVRHLSASFAQRFKSDRDYRRQQRTKRQEEKKSAKHARSALSSVQSVVGGTNNDQPGETIKPPRAPLRERFSSLTSQAGATIRQQVSNLSQIRRSPGRSITTSEPASAKPSTIAEDQQPRLKHRPILSMTGRSNKPAKPASPSATSVTTTKRSTPATEEQAATAPAEPKPTAKPSRLSRLKPKVPKTKTLSALEQAEQALSSVRLDQVEEILIPYIMKHPRDARAYMLLGQAASAKEDWDDAVQAFEFAVNLNPRTKGCLARLGHATYKAGHMTRAIEVLQRAHASDPKNTEIIKDLITIARQLDNTPMQESLIAELAELEPTAEQS